MVKLCAISFAYSPLRVIGDFVCVIHSFQCFINRSVLIVDKIDVKSAYGIFFKVTLTFTKLEKIGVKIVSAT